MQFENVRPHIVDRARAEIHDKYLSSKKAKELLGW